MKKTAKYIVVISIVFFLVISYLFISTKNENNNDIQYRASELQKVITEENETTITHYVNNGIITLAADLGYATIVVKTINRDTIELYYDAYGEPAYEYLGYYGKLKKNDTYGNNIYIAYIGKEGQICNTQNGYAIEERQFNEKGQLTQIKYYDSERNPVNTHNNGYGKINQYNKKGMIEKTTFIDKLGNPMTTKQGYASVLYQYIEDDTKDNKKKVEEFYYDSKGKPIVLSLGQHGISKVYDEEEQNIALTYLGYDGEPIVTKKGYTTITRKLHADNSVAIEKYYDIDGKPFSLAEGQYGFKKEKGQVVYLNKDGKEIFNIRTIMYNQSWIIIPITIFIVVLSTVSDKKINTILFVVYVFTIIYFTLLFRDSGETNKIELLSNYKEILVDSRVRADVLKNIWLFIPLGAISFQLYQKKTVVLIPVVLSILIELIQLFSRTGFCELNDVISNSIGGWIGYIAGKLTTSLKQRINK